MQYCTCTVRLRGEVGHERVGKIVTVAEIPVLREIHGHDSVLNVIPTDPPLDKVTRQPVARVDDRTELERLRSVYGPDLIGKVYAGFNVSVPRTMEDIGISPDKEADRLEKQAAELTQRAARLRGKDGKFAPAAKKEADADIFADAA